MTAITKPGVYDLPAEVYLRDPVPADLGGSLSNSGIKLLLPPNCPAIFDHARRNPTYADHFDFGHATHAKVLGVGAEIVTVDAPTWQTKAAREAKDQAHAEGKTPLLAKQVAVVDAMAAKVRQHPVAAALLANGKAEQALFARDKRAGVWLRGMFDWMTDVNGRLVIVDYKTTADNGNPDLFDRTMANFGYHRQAAFYRDLATAVGLDEDPAFLFIVQSKEPPYLVSVVEPDQDAIRIGQKENRDAIDLYARCVETNTWPGFGDDISAVTLPPWYITKTATTLEIAA